MHLWCTASQQVNEGRVEGHDGISQVYPVLLMLLLSSKPTGNTQLSIPLLNNTGGHNASSSEGSYIGKRLSFLTLGPSLAGSSDILMASSMAANRPLPPSPLRAGPKHSGLRMRRRTTTLAFSSTLSPAGGRDANVLTVITEGEKQEQHGQRNSILSLAI